MKGTNQVPVRIQRAAHAEMAEPGVIVMRRYAGSAGRMSMLSILSKPGPYGGYTVRARPLIEERVT